MTIEHLYEIQVPKSNYVLKCNTNGTGGLNNITWYKTNLNTIITNNNKYQIDISNNNDLIINHLNLNDTGYYICKCNNDNNIIKYDLIAYGKSID